jgi:hypothetical protein
MTEDQAERIIKLLKQILAELEEFHASFDKAS